MNRRFPKSSRFLSRNDFQSFKAYSKRMVGRYLCIDFSLSSRENSRLGITASRKFGPSWERNRFKRLVREAFRLNQDKWPFLDIHIVPRQKAKGVKLTEIEIELNLMLCPLLDIAKHDLSLNVEAADF